MHPNAMHVLTDHYIHSFPLFSLLFPAHSSNGVVLFKIKGIHDDSMRSYSAPISTFSTLCDTSCMFFMCTTKFLLLIYDTWCIINTFSRSIHPLGNATVAVYVDMHASVCRSLNQQFMCCLQTSQLKR